MNMIIERVARAIYADTHRQGAGHGNFDILLPEVKAGLVSMARAAIEAMREPDAAMSRAGVRAIQAFEFDDPDGIMMDYRDHVCWQAMISACLTPKEET